MSSNFARRSLRKKQTRLAFDPVESSSSATMSPARIRYQKSSSSTKHFNLTTPERVADDNEDKSVPSGKKYAVVIETPNKVKKNGQLPFKPLATPAKSSQTSMDSANSAGHSDGDHSDSDLEIITTFRRQRVHRLGESSSSHSLFRLPSGPLEVSSPPTSGHNFMPGNNRRRLVAYDGTKDDSSAGSSPEEKEQADNHKKRPRTPRKRPPGVQHVTLSGDDSGAESSLESPPKVNVTRGRIELSRNESSMDSDQPKSADMRSLISGGTINFSQKVKKTPRRRSTRYAGNAPDSSSRKGTRRTTDTSALSDDEDETAILPTPRSTAIHGTRSRPAIINDDSEEPSGGYRSSRRRYRTVPTSTDERASEDELPSFSQIKSSAARTRTGTGAAEDEDADEEEDAVVVRSSVKRRLRKRTEKDDDRHDTDEDDEDPISSPLKRRRTVVEDESESDPFTSPSNKGKTKAPTTRVTRQQVPSKSHRTAREKKLELLKRQRAGEKIVELTSSESDAEEFRQGIYDSNSDLEVLSDFEDEEKDEDDGIEEVRRSLNASNQNDNDDEFIVDDEDMPLGVPQHSLNSIPLQFTHQAHKPLKEHFKDTIEWMIQNKINPAFNRKDPIYLQAFKKLDTEVQGYATSIYSSSVWKEAFTRALRARPEFSETEIAPGDEHEGNKCDACGRSNHPAKFEIRFSGKAYFKDTLDEVDNDHGGEDDEDDDSNSTTSVNSDGQSLVGTDFSWFVGRFCKANAQTAHSLIHWRHALNDWVIDRLKANGFLAPQELALREDWNTSKRSKYANRIVDDWEAEGEIKALYRDFKINLDVARQGKLTRWSK